MTGGKLRRGFTMIELMLAIGIIGTLAGIVIAAVNPSLQFATAADAKRRASQRELGNAIQQYIIKVGSAPGDKAIPTGIGNVLPVCKAGQANASCVNLDSLVPDYLAALPVDPSETSSIVSGYGVYSKGPQTLAGAMYLDGGIAGSCKQIKAEQPTAADGTYWLKPSDANPFQAYCDMTTDGGGWTIITAFTGAASQQPLTSDTETSGNPLSFQAYNIDLAKKMGVNTVSSEFLARRNNSTWIKVNAAPFDANIKTANQHNHISVTVTANNGTTAAGVVGYSNFGNSGGGDFGIASNVGFDHHNTTSYNHLNGGCANHYLYSYGTGGASYDSNTALGTWTASDPCGAPAGGLMVGYFALR